MAFKKRRARRAEEEEAENAPHFSHASGYTDLARVVGDHTLDAAQEAAVVPPKGYRSRSVAGVETRRR
jgi:hypothetical protein